MDSESRRRLLYDDTGFPSDTSKEAYSESRMDLRRFRAGAMTEVSFGAMKLECGENVPRIESA